MEKTIKNKVYQMFVLGLEGEELKENQNLINALQNGLGGVIFFTQNIQTTKQFKKLIENVKNEAPIPPFLSIDQEGGRVERTENIFGGKKYLSAKFAAEQGEEFLRNQTEQISHLLKDFGINLNFAPCTDVNTNPNNPIIGERAFSNDPDEVIKFAKIVIDTYLKNGIIPCAKHFPGHGDANVDSHISLPKINLSLEEMEKTHIKPFKEIKSPMLMVAHLHCSAFDKDEIPSSLSKNVIGYLRNNLNYKGLIITDDMIMGGISGQKEINSSTISAIKAIKAGVNLLLYRNSFDETIQIIEDLAELAQYDEELFNSITTSFDRIIEFKKSVFI
ncbi:MAG: glycoside hydrolase family 3 N-terminal domain-containing protein [bacterium]